MDTLPPPVTPTLSTDKPGGRWPKILGIIAILFGAGGILQGAIGPVSLLLTRTQMNSFVELGASQENIDAYLEKLSQITYAGAASAALLGILLLLGGILLLKRRKACSPTLQSWAVLKLLVGGFMLFQSMSLSRMQMDIIMPSTQLGGPEGELFGTITSYAVWFGFAFGFIWLAALPVFSLIWFNRDSVKREISEW